MSETRNTPDELGDELRALGANLKDMLQAAWESDERKRAQQEIGNGLEDLARTLRSAGQEFSASPTGERLKADMRDLRERLQEGQVDVQVRRELVAALRRVNEELGKAVRAWSAEGARSPGPKAGAGKPEEAS